MSSRHSAPLLQLDLQVCQSYQGEFLIKIRWGRPFSECCPSIIKKKLYTLSTFKVQTIIRSLFLVHLWGLSHRSGLDQSESCMFGLSTLWLADVQGKRIQSAVEHAVQAGSDRGPALVLIISPKCWLRWIVRVRRACTRADRVARGPQEVKPICQVCSSWNITHRLKVTGCLVAGKSVRGCKGAGQLASALACYLEAVNSSR